MPFELIRPAQADRQQAIVAGELRRRGFVAGDRVGLCVPSSSRLLHAIGGALRSGIIPVVASNQLLAAERQVIRDDADVRWWIDDETELSELFEGAPGELASVPLGRPMHYTSGTTGRPKGVWSGVLPEGEAERLWGEERDQWQLAGDDVHVVCSPLQHSAPIRFALGTLLAGGTVVLPGPFSVDGLVAAVAESGATSTFCTPAHLQRLDEQGALGVLSSLRLVAHAGAPCPEALKRRAIDAVGSRLWEFYGSTEGQFTVCSADEWLQRPGTVGRARHGRVLEIGADEVVWSHTPSWARWTYWRDPVRTAEAWRDDAFTVGDLGRLDAEGYLYLVGRRSDLIISGGMNVYPAEVEGVLAKVPGVVDVVVFPRPDERWGQRVCVAVVGDVDSASVSQYAETHLAAYKRPKEVHVVTAIPRFGLSKVRRATVAQELGLDVV
ncbi:MAG TPA: AMP-binding protein [Ilumatobacteraceae bacterium]|nr:AMP-binding protein [Ilumatobacteraceae bacterium]HRB03728.1 AMP-binding protein [Ilumatobacteraceae bacterium]